jgi:hypothetical protein
MRYTVEKAKKTEKATHDAEGNPMLNSAGQPLENPRDTPAFGLTIYPTQEMPAEQRVRFLEAIRQALPKLEADSKN